MAKKKLEAAYAFAEKLKAPLADNLVSLILFGSHARPGYSVGHAEVNLFLVVGDASTAALHPIAPHIAEWVARREPPPLIMSEEEWRDSADVFPIEVEDMRDAHELLAGRDPFADVTTNTTDLRNELEREIRGKLLRLRSEYAATSTDGKALTRLLLDSVGTFFVLMRALVRLVGGTPQATPQELVQQASDTAGLDADAFEWVVRNISGRTVTALTANDPVGAAYVNEIEKMARFVDQFDNAVTH
jgi:hypothetical protein